MNCQVAIIGAGPYGLAAAAHLRHAGIETHVFGQPMDFWEERMPAGMLLRSPLSASHISDPLERLTLQQFSASEGEPLPNPIPLGTFVSYGRWFQRHVAPDLDVRRVLHVDHVNGGFRLGLGDGEAVIAARVVIAAGIGTFARRPAEFDGLPGHLVTHSADETRPARHAGRRVIVVGGGQSALECAALVHEAGAEVEVLVRRPRVIWHDQRALWLKSPRNPLRPLLYPPTDVGPPGLNLLVAAPDVFRRLPRSLQDRIAYRCIRPAGAWWLPPRMRGVRITAGRTVRAAMAAGRAIRLTLDDGTRRSGDHVILATGFRVDVAKYPFLPPWLLRKVRTVDGYPELTRGFESSVPGLHFLGAPAAHSFGPLFRFVAGTPYAGRALTSVVRSRARGWTAVRPQAAPLESARG